jgi:hypothetical protein
MTKPMITIHNCETQEIEIREMNEAEFTQWELAQAQRTAEIAAQADKEAARQALLTKLGISDEEAKLLLS